VSTPAVRHDASGYHLTADELRLPWAPNEDTRQKIRDRLRPWLKDLRDINGKSIGLVFKGCYGIAQALTATAKNPDVWYVEGVWETHRRALEGRTEKHGWNIAYGVRVDILAELLDKVFIQEDREYQGLEKYSLQDLLEVNAWHPLKSHDISGPLRLRKSVVFKELLEKEDLQGIRKLFEEMLPTVTEEAFQPAVNTFMARFANGTRRNEEKP
jgi:hypothetical protein